MALADKLKHVQAFRDAPSASQQNVIVDVLQGLPLYVNPRVPYPFDAVRVHGAWEYCKVVSISSITGTYPRGIAYEVENFAANNTDNFEILICDGPQGWASFGFHPVRAYIEGTSNPSIGAMVGPKSGQTKLWVNYPGFRFLGESDIEDYGWVIRDRGIATGQGVISASSGQSGPVNYFELEEVTFSSGFNGWDHAASLNVLNVFGDDAEAGLKVQFKWDVALGDYVSTDVECA